MEVGAFAIMPGVPIALTHHLEGDKECPPPWLISLIAQKHRRVAQSFFAKLHEHQFDTCENSKVIGSFSFLIMSILAAFHADFGRKVLNVWKLVTNRVLE